MNHTRRSRRWLLALCLLPFGLSAAPLFDVHLHYSAADARAMNPQAIISRLDHNRIRYAVVTGTPSAHTLALHRHAPDRIIPLLGIYRSHADKIPWPHDDTLPARLETQLKQGHWRGIGELHIFAQDRHSTVLRRVVELAAQYRLPLQLHADPAVIDRIYDIAPRQTVIWAHAGTYPYPDLIADYLQRYPALYVDLSMRDGRIAPGGHLDEAWYELFIRHPERFMVGVDTYSLPRWQEFDSAVATLRAWLAQLPDDIAAKLAYDNAARLFKKAP
ncbi:MAG: TatD family hydrolase [Gammaproteobacteria bacterium]